MESAMAFACDPSQHSPGVTSENHVRPKSGMGGPGIEPGSSRMRVQTFKIAEPGPTAREQSEFSPPTKANRVHHPAESLRIFASGNRAGRCRWSAGFLEDLPFPLALAIPRLTVLTSFHPVSYQDLILAYFEMSLRNLEVCTNQLPPGKPIEHWASHVLPHITGAVHLSNDNAGVLKPAQRGQKPRVEQKGKSWLDPDSQYAVVVRRAATCEPALCILGYKRKATWRSSPFNPEYHQFIGTPDRMLCLLTNQEVILGHASHLAQFGSPGRLQAGGRCVHAYPCFWLSGNTDLNERRVVGSRESRRGETRHLRIAPLPTNHGNSLSDAVDISRILVLHFRNGCKIGKKRPCCVPGCADKLFRRSFRAWLHRIRNPKLQSLVKKKVYGNYLVCELHFNHQCINPGSKSIIIYSEPSLLLPG
ncbi:hypothetical protein PR048_013748 [Dryococelus australis]|uniref:THAP-type domain-containing protein n=1 Tax=Dryococelus australis TaxID=614101 RepID=A0ABQ9HT27_9NEOP|nr:hypothetical protein PR048_013748 [Dryococelus australis]